MGVFVGVLVFPVQTSALMTRLDSDEDTVVKLCDEGHPMILPAVRLLRIWSLSTNTLVGHSTPIRSPDWTAITGEIQNCWRVPRFTVLGSKPTHW